MMVRFCIHNVSVFTTKKHACEGMLFLLLCDAGRTFLLSSNRKMLPAVDYSTNVWFVLIMPRGRASFEFFHGSFL